MVVGRWGCGDGSLEKGEGRWELKEESRKWGDGSRKISPIPTLFSLLLSPHYHLPPHLPTPNSTLPSRHSHLPTSFSSLPSPHPQRPTPFFPLQSPHSLLPTTFSPLNSLHSHLPTPIYISIYKSMNIYIFTYMYRYGSA